MSRIESFHPTAIDGRLAEAMTAPRGTVCQGGGLRS